MIPCNLVCLQRGHASTTGLISSRVVQIAVSATIFGPTLSACIMFSTQPANPSGRCRGQKQGGQCGQQTLFRSWRQLPEWTACPWQTGDCWTITASCHFERDDWRGQLSQSTIWWGQPRLKSLCSYRHPTSWTKRFILQSWISLPAFGKSQAASARWKAGKTKRTHSQAETTFAGGCREGEAAGSSGAADCNKLCK